MNQNEIKSIVMLLNEAKESAKMQRELIEGDLESYGIDSGALEELVKSQEEGFKLTDEKVEEYCEKIKLEGADEIIESFQDESGNSGKRAWIEYGIASVESMISSEEDLEELEDEANGEIKSYTDYICSEAYDKHRMQNIEMWKSMIERETNPAKIAKLKKSIYIVENRYTLAFMFERLHNEKTASKEHQAILDSFFNNARSNYMMEKFADKCEQFGFSHDLYRYLLDIEERYLEEKYHVFNNFFLFSAMRFIGHCGSEEINMAKEVVQCMLNLIYNRFYSEEVKETFLNTIRSFLDEFMDDTEIFNEKNILHPGHPYRIQKKKEKDAALRARIYEQLTIKGYANVEEEKESLDAMEINELLSYYNEREAEAVAAEEAKKEAEEAARLAEEDSEDEEEYEESDNGEEQVSSVDDGSPVVEE